MNTDAIDKATYDAIKNAIMNDDLDKALSLMKDLSSIEEEIIPITGRLSDLNRRKNIGELSFADENNLRSQIRNSIFELFQTLEVKSTPQATQTTPSTHQFVTHLQGFDDRKLSFNHSFLGREEALASFMEQKAKAGGYRMLITGTGGIGKTDFCKAILKAILK